MELEWQDLGRLLAASLAGAVIGFERELHDKPAGLRTNIMICLGAALFTLLSIRMAGGSATHDPGRIAAQIVTGVGFLGAGAIIHLRGHVVGLTTAATIWLVASVGMAFGAGQLVLGIVVTLVAAGILFGLTVVENRIANWRTTVKFEIKMEASPELSQAIKERLKELRLRRKSWLISKTVDGFTGFLEVSGPEARVDRLHNALLAEPGIKSLTRL